MNTYPEKEKIAVVSRYLNGEKSHKFLKAPRYPERPSISG